MQTYLVFAVFSKIWGTGCSTFSVLFLPVVKQDEGVQWWAKKWGDRICAQRRLLHVWYWRTGWEILVWHMTVNPARFVMCLCLEVKNCPRIVLTGLSSHAGLQVRIQAWSRRFFKECKLNEHVSCYVLVVPEPVRLCLFLKCKQCKLHPKPEVFWKLHNRKACLSDAAGHKKSVLRPCFKSF